MNGLNIFTIIERIYNALNNRSLLSFLPFLILERLSEDDKLCRFQQYKGDFVSSTFDISDFMFKEFVFITPYRYFLNKNLIKKIQGYVETRNYSIFVSFLSPIKLHISLYNLKSPEVINYKMKLFSGHFDFNFMDKFFLPLFGSKKIKLELKQRRLQEELNKVNQVVEALGDDFDYKKATKNTMELIKKLKKLKQEERVEENKKEEMKLYKEQIQKYLKDLNEGSSNE